MTLYFTNGKRYKVQYITEDWTISEIEGIFVDQQISLDFPSENDISSLAKSKIYLFFHVRPGMAPVKVDLSRIGKAEQLP